MPWRTIGAALLAVSGGVHGYLYAAEDYRAIPTVGPLFLVATVVAGLLAVAVVLARRPVVDLVGAAFALSVLGAYLVTLLVPTGLFLYHELSVSAPGALSVGAESGVVVTLGWAAARTVATYRRGR